MQLNNEENGNIQKIQENILKESQQDMIPQVKYYKYGLPIPNIDPQIKGIEEIFEKKKYEIVTPNQRLWNVLNLNENTPYEAYQMALRHKYNNEIDMYGDIEDEVSIREIQQKEYGNLVIPINFLECTEYMDRMKRNVSINFNIPGTLENEHPHKFIQNLRPLQEFRNTPLIPISEKQMQDHQKKMEEYNRKGFYFEVKRDTIYNWILAFFAFSVGFYMIRLVIKKEEEQGIEVERIKIRRIQQNNYNYR
ncbi:hypothetical protein IMG5_018840 [Ichthyophthirius multifiliis]|uniref:Transmembrane protein n=1 Tax=Ichthyophthirius multifiliis TaxID=5932 RepID=G0QKJ5_ICHMU|nr:hypothetical protein IMG5_018840 [Ichthyophthirius multifiliis]EGR34259.1 hypothetical protein IMG5_018840 [Ichthyophthirius multifiliis]|eukprot:XP_004039563.1 hypothetical protein IMG5_018840 [Ichthyophthirius multifiliis]